MTPGAITTQRASFIAAAVVVAVLLLASAVQAAGDLGAGDLGDGKQASPSATVVEYTVRGGDSLWLIAEAHTAPGADVRPTVDAIRTLNRLDTSTIHSGQTLLIPAG